MAVNQALKDAYEGVSASNAVGTPNAGVLDQHPGEYIFQKYVEIAESCGIVIDVEDCFQPGDQPEPFNQLEEEQGQTQEQEFVRYSHIYSSAINKFTTLVKDEDEYSEFRTAMFNTLHQDQQFCRVCAFLVSGVLDGEPIFETDLRENEDEWFFDGNELEDEKVSYIDESVDEYLLEGATYPCEAYSVYLDRNTEQVCSLVDRWTMQSIIRSTYDECNNEKTELDDPDVKYIVVKSSGHGFHHHHHEGSAQWEGTIDECRDWIADNSSPNANYHSTPRFEIKYERTLIPEKYHPSIILRRMNQIANKIYTLRMFHINLQLRNWLIYGPPQGNTLRMRMNDSDQDDQPKSAPNPLPNYPDDDSKQFVCKLRPGKWSNELNTLADAFTKLPPGFELAILLWAHSANSNFTGSIHSQIKASEYKNRVAGIVHYDNRGTYISEHEYTQDGWKLVDKNPEHKGPIEGFD